MHRGRERRPAAKRDAAAISKIMALVRSRDTKPELALRYALRSAGLSFKLYAKSLPGHPDFVFTKERVVVFLDGDFWHGRQWRLRGLPSLSRQFTRSRNRAYWLRKIARNVERDARVTRSLRRLGWRVVRIWGSDLKASPERCVRRVCRALERSVA